MANSTNNTSESGDSSENGTATASSNTNDGGQGTRRSRTLSEEKTPKKSFAKIAEELWAASIQMARNVINNLGFGGKEATAHLESSVTADLYASGGKMDASRIVNTVVQNAQKVFGDLVTQQQLFIAKNMSEVALCSFAPNAQQSGQQQAQSAQVKFT